MGTLDNPVKIRSGTILPNRLALAPLTNTQSNSDGTIHQDEINWLVRRAGNFGLISTCATYISEEGKAWDGQLGISNDFHIEGLKKLTNAIKTKGSIIIIQLHHAGAKANLAPQKISTVDDDDIRGASIVDIKRITQDFVDAALRAEKAGFDGVEIHSANGYLFTQFLSPRDNTRQDQYGGNLENRSRFLRETLQAIRQSVSNNFMVNVRISPVDLYDDRGLILKDSIKLSKWLAEDGVDIIHLSLKDASGAPPLEKTDEPVVSAIQNNIPKDVKIASAGGIWTQEDAKQAISVGCDIIVLGKAAIYYPNWHHLSKQDTFSPIRKQWDPDYLRQVDLGEDFIEYLKKFPDLVQGGKPSRT